MENETVIITKKQKLNVWIVTIFVLLITFIAGGWFGYNNAQNNAEEQIKEYLTIQQEWVKDTPDSLTQVERKAFVDDMTSYYMTEKNKKKK